MKVDAVEPKSLFETRRDKEDFSIYVLLISKKVDFWVSFRTQKSTYLQIGPFSCPFKIRAVKI